MKLDGLTRAYLNQVDGEKITRHIPDGKLASKYGLISFYKSQLKKFSKIGLGNKTDFNVMVTPALIAITIKRLEELYINKAAVGLKK